MALYLPIRAISRSQNVRVGGVKITRDTTSYVDISVATTRRDLERFQALGALIIVGGFKANDESFAVWSGCKIDEGASAADRILGIQVGELRKDDGTYVTVAASTTAVTLAAADATFGRKDIVTINNAGTVAFTTGTVLSANSAAAGATAPTAAAGQLLLATVDRAATDDAIANAEITDSRERV